jgi:hypothetical protein
MNTNLTSAQEHKIPVQNSMDGKLTLLDFMEELPIEGYAGNEIIISTDADVNSAPPERAKGLKPIYPNGTDNTGIGLYVEKNGNQVTVQCSLPITKRGEYKIKVPDNFALQIESGCERSNNINIQNMKNEIEIKNCHSIHLKNVSGPLVLSTISGDIEIVYGTISTDKPVNINSVSGEIDISLPVKTAANIEMKTISGAIYSDFDFPTDNKNMKQVAGSTIKYALNGGGTEFKIISVSGNIYLRKGK